MNEIMSERDISINVLLRMKKTEGIVFQGCGGEPQEWIDGINDMLRESRILLDDTKFSDVFRFQNNGVTCLLFPFNPDVQLDTGKLAVWRLSTHSQFGGTWLSDYVPNELGGYLGERVKPDCALIGESGNIFHLAGKAAQTLKQNGMRMEAQEMLDKVMSSGSYDEALGVIGDYVNITDGSESEDFDEGQGMSL